MTPVFTWEKFLYPWPNFRIPESKILSEKRNKNPEIPKIFLSQKDFFFLLWVKEYLLREYKALNSGSEELQLTGAK